jgi:hypothetical protein
LIAQRPRCYRPGCSWSAAAPAWGAQMADRRRTRRTQRPSSPPAEGGHPGSCSRQPVAEPPHLQRAVRCAHVLQQPVVRSQDALRPLVVDLLQQLAGVHQVGEEPFAVRSGHLLRPRLEGRGASRVARTEVPIWARAPRFETAAEQTRPSQRERRGDGLRLTKYPQICRTPAVIHVTAESGTVRSLLIRLRASPPGSVWSDAYRESCRTLIREPAPRTQFTTHFSVFVEKPRSA